MKKFIVLLTMCFMFTGCSSLIPRITMDSPNTVPQQTEKSKIVEKCKGEYKTDEMGNMLYCSKGYYSNAYAFNKAERKMTFTERVKSMINRLVGFGFWGLLLILILCPSVIGLVAGRVIEGTVGATGQALKSTVRAIKKAKRNGGKFMEELDKEHNKDKKVQKKINQLRAEE